MRIEIVDDMPKVAGGLTNKQLNRNLDKLMKGGFDFSKMFSGDRMGNILRDVSGAQRKQYGKK